MTLCGSVHFFTYRFSVMEDQPQLMNYLNIRESVIKPTEINNILISETCRICRWDRTAGVSLCKQDCWVCDNSYSGIERRAATGRGFSRRQPKANQSICRNIRQMLDKRHRTATTSKTVPHYCSLSRNNKVAKGRNTQISGSWVTH